MGTPPAPAISPMRFRHRHLRRVDDSGYAPLCIVKTCPLHLYTFTVCGIPSVVIFGKAILTCSMDVGLKQQLLCSPIGNRELVRENKTSRLRGRRTIQDLHPKEGDSLSPFFPHCETRDFFVHHLIYHVSRGVIIAVRKCHVVTSLRRKS